MLVQLLVTEMSLWKCIICGTEAKDSPPRRCPRCDTPAARFRLVCDRAPTAPKPPPVEEAAPAEDEAAKADAEAPAENAAANEEAASA